MSLSQTKLTIFHNNTTKEIMGAVQAKKGYIDFPLDADISPGDIILNEAPKEKYVIKQIIIRDSAGDGQIDQKLAVIKQIK
jgi:hypothetical protein